jgi:hypothetical protein
MTDTILILFAIEVGYIPATEGDLVTNLLFLVIIAAALASAVLVFRSERIARRAPVAAAFPVSSGHAAERDGASKAALPRDLEHSVEEFLGDPLVRQAEID